MFTYKFVRIDLVYSGFFAVSLKPEEDYKSVVANHAREGWRLVQIFAPSTSGTGWASYFELIFERPRA